MLSKKYRLSSKEFKQVYFKGTKVKGTFGMLVYIPSSLSYPQFGFVVSKKIGNAVKRHKMTRRLRNIVWELIRKEKVGHNKYQYIAFKYADNYQDLQIELEKQLIK